jgi:hypothetical protein
MVLERNHEPYKIRPTTKTRNLPPDMRRSPTRTAAVIVIVAISYQWAVFLAMHVLEPEFDPLRTPGSVYVLGAYGSWMTSSYFAISAALLGASRGLMLELPASGLRVAAICAFVVAAAGCVLAGIFPMDFPGSPHTSAGRLHALGGMLTFPIWMVGTFLFSVLVRRDVRWAATARSLLLLSVASVATFALLICSVRILGYAGYAQRLLLLLFAAWLILVARHLLRLSHVAASRSSQN